MATSGFYIRAWSPGIFKVVGALYHLNRQQWFPLPSEQVFQFFSNPQNLEAITPPWLNLRIATPTPMEIDQGTEIDYLLSWWIVPLRWKTVITHWSPPHFFVDVQRSGPFRFWEHTHTFREEEGGTRMFDTVRYELPLGFLGRIAHRLRIRQDLNRIFDYRAARIGERFGVAPAAPSSSL
jgi:ligand-binding SRPBCC domain-containing protein